MDLRYRVYFGRKADETAVSREVQLAVGEHVSLLTVPADSEYVDLPVIPLGDMINVTFRDVFSDGAGGDWSKLYKWGPRNTLVPRMPGAVRVALLDSDSEPENPAEKPEPVVEPEPELVVEPEPEPVVEPEPEDL